MVVSWWIVAFCAVPASEFLIKGSSTYSSICKNLEGNLIPLIHAVSTNTCAHMCKSHIYANIITFMSNFVSTLEQKDFARKKKEKKIVLGN